MYRDWRTVFVYPWWLIAAICFAVGCGGVYAVFRLWLVPTYTLWLIRGGA